jgi:hypothetical protein
MPTTQLSSDPLRQAPQLSEWIDSLQQRLIPSSANQNHGRHHLQLRAKPQPVALVSKAENCHLQPCVKCELLNAGTLGEDQMRQWISCCICWCHESTNIQGNEKSKLTREGRAKLAAAMKAYKAARKRCAHVPIVGSSGVKGG